jgi:mono/diheme cytochrome c family protein
LFQAGDTALVADYTALSTDKDLEVVLQVLNSLRYSKDPAVKKLILEIAAKHPFNEAITATAQQSHRFDPEKPSGFNPKLDPVAMALSKKGHESFSQLCFACHGIDGKGVISNDGIRMGPTLAGSARVLGNKEALTRIVLHGLTGEIDGQNYSGLMLPMKGNDDQWVAEVLTYIRTAFGNSASSITREDVAAIRAASNDRTTSYTMAELAPWLPVPKSVMATWSASASKNSNRAKLACDADTATRWDTGGKQEAGQWFQIDLGQPWQLTRLTFDAQASAGDWPRGWELTLSDDGITWSKPLAKGESLKVPVTVLDFPLPAHTSTRYVRLTQILSGATGNFWSINEIAVYGEARK